MFGSIHRGLKNPESIWYPLKDCEAYREHVLQHYRQGHQGKGLTEAFLILEGVMLGDTLAPYLYVMRQACELVKTTGSHSILLPRRSRRSTEFADDLALFADSVAEAKRFPKA